MRGTIQDGLRSLISFWVRLLGHGLELLHRIRLTQYRRRYQRLRDRYGLEDDTPICRHGEVLNQRLKMAAGQGVNFAATSGSSGVPKQIPYSKGRVRQVKALYMDAFCRAFSAMGIRRTSLYVFSATKVDDSLTSLMMAERRDLPPYLSTLQAPYRVHGHPRMLALEDRYGSAAVRFWVLVISNPGAIYATNPSTIALFLEGLSSDWSRSTKLIQDWLDNPKDFHRDIRRIAARLSSKGDSKRLLAIRQSGKPLPFSECVPGLSFLCCWDGGYVRPYLDRVWAHLDAVRCRHLPMYSMSTETVETLPHFNQPGVAFLPVAPGVLYEFLPAGAEEHPDALLRPEQLDVGHEYSMVVSDPWGLIRYHTEDVFSVERMIDGLPDLRFRRRLGLAFSFTGEKLTGDHAREAVRRVINQRQDLEHVPWMVMVPAAKPQPHYKLVVASDEAVLGASQVAQLLDSALSEVNREYADKRRSCRLISPKVVIMSFDDALRSVGRQPPDRRWETQFKFLPLVTTTWERLMTEEQP